MEVPLLSGGDLSALVKVCGLSADFIKVLPQYPFPFTLRKVIYVSCKLNGLHSWLHFMLFAVLGSLPSICEETHGSLQLP